MGFWDWLSGMFGGNEEEEAPPEPLVLGAELKCPHGSENSYLIVYAKDVDVGGLPAACVSDCKAYENIMPFGSCRFGGSCAKHMELEKQWENPEPQKTLSNGKEIITTKSILVCRRIGAGIQAVKSGQDGIKANELLMCCEIEEKYPGLLDILRNPDGSLYLNEGMYEKAIQFLEDCIEKYNGTLPTAAIYAPTNLETQLMMLTFEKLIPGYDAANQTTFINAMEGIALSPGMDNLPEWDTHILNQEMIEALKVYCANEADKTKTNILSGVAEKYKRPLKILGNSMQNTGYSLMLYSISAGYWKNAIVYGGNGANAFNIVAGNTLTTDLVTLDSVTEIALQNAMLNSTAVLTAAGSAAVLNNNLALSVLQNDIAGLNEYTKNALKGGTDSKIRPSNTYDVDAKPSGTSTRITDKMDDATRHSLIRENEAAETIARNGYSIEQNPIVEGTTRNPDYKIEGEIFDCYSPAENTKIRNIASTIEEKVIEKGQANRIVLNLDDWNGNINELVNQLNEYPIEGLEEVLVVQDGKVISIYP